MGLRIGPNPQSVEAFQRAASLLCYVPEHKISSPLLNLWSASNKSLACRLARQPTRFGLSYSRGNLIKRACSSNFDELSDEELFRQRFDLPEYDEEIDNDTACTFSEISGKTSHRDCGTLNVKSWHVAALKLDFLEPSLLGIQPEPPHWPEKDDVARISIERRANRGEIPISLRIIKRKQQLQQNFKKAGDFSCCSVKRAFSSMVFIIGELQSYALHMRETLYCEDLQMIIDKVQRELNASFVWLFQQVFSRTPTLMVYVMILIADFTVCSMHDNISIAAAAASPEVSCATATVTENSHQPESKFDAMTSRSFLTLSSSIGKGSGGGGRDKVSPVPRGTEGGDKNSRRPSMSTHHPNVVLDCVSEVSLSKNNDLASEEELNLWKSVVEEASRMQAEMGRETIDHGTMQQLVSPVSVELEADEYDVYFRTDLLYQIGLSQEPNNPLLLSNYAQFLHLVAHDNDRLV